MYIYHIFFIHSSIGGHIDRVHNLAVVWIMLVSLLCGDFDSLRYIPRIGITGSHGSSIVCFLRNMHLVSIVTGLIYIPTNSV
jgi:hypothetical protein